MSENLETYFAKFKKNVVGDGLEFDTVNGKKNLLYADWTASGRLYKDIEEKLSNEFGPFLGNTHTEVNLTGSAMTKAYHRAKEIIKNHVGATDADIMISAGSGMTGAIAKFMRILGVKFPDISKDFVNLDKLEKPIVFISHMEHHSNQTMWEEAFVDVRIINFTEKGLVDTNHLKELLEEYKDRKIKFASVTGCSNVTGIKTPYYEIAKIMHQNGGKCFVDFACSAPYVEINMHPEDPDEKLDAIFFSPHKFLGGPGTSGIAIFCKTMYKNVVPDIPGGGTVKWTNPWGGHSYFEDEEAREDGGTPPFMQTIKTALAVQLKEEMGTDKIWEREEEIVEKVLDRLSSIPNVHVLAEQCKNRLAVFSFYIDNCHYNLGVKLLNDMYGIQVRGGCSCAGTYGHFLLHVDAYKSQSITDKIEMGDLSEKPGWIRLSIHPVTSNAEIDQILEAIENVAANFKELSKDYVYENATNNYVHKNCLQIEDKLVESWFA